MSYTFSSMPSDFVIIRKLAADGLFAEALTALNAVSMSDASPETRAEVLLLRIDILVGLEEWAHVVMLESEAVALITDHGNPELLYRMHGHIGTAYRRL